jgi:flagellar protein FliO/FliZ
VGTVATVGRLLVSLAVVLGLMWVIARRMKRPLRGRSSRLIDVLGRQQLSRTSSVALVRVLDQALILGVTDGRVSVLGEADLATARAQLAETDAPRVPPRAPERTATATTLPERGTGPLAGSALSAGTWRQTVEAMRDLTARRR